MASETVTAPAEMTRPGSASRVRSSPTPGASVVDVDDLTLGEEPIEGLIGPNGAGKTTLMRMVMHSIPLDRGTVTLSPAERQARSCSRRSPAQRIAHHGVVKSNQVIMDFDKLTIWDSLLLSVAEAALRAAVPDLVGEDRLQGARGGDAPLPRLLRLRRPHHVRPVGG